MPDNPRLWGVGRGLPIADDRSPIADPANIAIVVVTYDDRLTCLQETVDAALTQRGVTRLIVVDNGSAPRVGAWLASLAAREPRLMVVHYDENRGSAGGFRGGLAAARATCARFIWVLDDDTRPEAGAAEALVEAWAALPMTSGQNIRALLSQRWAAARYRRESSWKKDAAFGVDLFDRAWHLVSRYGRADEVGGEVLLRMAPWSGLFFERALLDIVGLPDERLVTYEDDHEFTLRMTGGSARILLVPRSRLDTLVPSWHEEMGDDRRAASPWLATTDTRRVYYGARNRVHVERRRLVSNPARHHVNLLAFAVRTIARARKASDWHNARWFLAGIADGWRGRLGPRVVPGVGR